VELEPHCKGLPGRASTELAPAPTEGSVVVADPSRQLKRPDRFDLEPELPRVANESQAAHVGSLIKPAIALGAG
jgi:hypothetical protein